MTRHAIIYAGQSLEIGQSSGVTPAAIPVSSALAPTWFTLIDDVPTATAFGNLDVTSPGGYRGPWLATSAGLAQRRIHHANVVLVRGATFISQWCSATSGVFSPTFLAQIAAAKAKIATDYLGEPIQWHFCWNQGQSEVASANPVPATLYAERFGLLMQDVITATGQAVIRPHIMLCSSQQADKPNFDVMRAQQLLAVAQWNGFALNNDDLPLDPADNLHWLSPQSNIAGDRRFASLLTEFNMGSLATYAKNKVIDHVRNVATHTPAATHYYHLYAGGVALTGVNAPGYVVKSATNNKTTYANATARGVATAIALTWVSPSGTWLSPDEVRITDNATEGAGNEIGRDTFTAVPVTVVTGPFNIAAGALTITAPSGGFVDTFVHGALNLMFGGTAFTQLVTTFGCWTVGDVQAGGADVGSRVSITQASKWGAASGGVAQTSGSIALTQQVTGTWWAEYDASSAGNLVFTCQRTNPLTGAAGTILAGQLLTSIG